jgi:glycosyltransferase involved in cell wall biosynthesis
VPSLRPTGPVKGAVALANALSSSRSVSLVSLKPGPGVDARLEPAVNVVELHREGGWISRIAAYRRRLREAGGRARVASISFCLSADMVNLLCRREALLCSSVRGNLPGNYRFDYGPAGLPAAWAHLILLRGMDRVVAMTRTMGAQVSAYLGKEPAVIGNFIDEIALERYRKPKASSGAYRFVFVGSLSRRKRPDLVLQAAAQLRANGVPAEVDMVGSGPLREQLERLAKSLGLAGTVRFAGHLADPYPVLACADCVVLPSHAEGISRAVLEALFLGVPCVARNVDGMGELILGGENGFLFGAESELAGAMQRCAILARQRVSRESLLPAAFTQGPAAMQYLALVEAS